jgi:hypothetical protein
MDPLCATLLSKIDEQIERTGHLIALLPENQLGWQPPIPGAWPPGVLLGHLLECLAGFCAVLYAVEPDRLRHFADLRHLPVNHLCGKDEACGRMAAYRSHIHRGFDLLQDADLTEPVPTIFVKQGERLLTLLLGNLEHLINHKHQLFTYLKLLDVNTGSRDLYRFRGE